ncbi:MAG: hypothetical protein ACKOX0_02025, partial [Bacteroidota bacterium]
MRRTALLFFVILALSAGAQPLVVPNQGQWQGDFRAKTALSDGAVFWHDQGYRIQVVHPKHRGGATPNPHYPTHQWPETWPDAHALFVEFEGAQPQSKSAGSQPTPSPRHYLKGSDPARWVTNVPEFEDWRTADVYPGIDFVVHAHGSLKSEWQVKPGADPSRIALRIRGCQPQLGAEGELRLETA